MMSAEIKDVEAVVSSLFGERRQLMGEKEIEVCGAIVNLPEFDSLSSEQQKRVLSLGLDLEGNVLSSLRGLLDRERLESQIGFILETAESIGASLTKRVFEVAIESAEKAWGVKKSE